MKDTIFIDATDLVVGRACSTLVPYLMGGKKVVVVNAEKAIISGNPNFTVKKYLQLRARKTLTNPRRGPFFPRMPDRIFRRTARNMLPYKTNSGKRAYKNLHVYISIPDEYKDVEFQTIEHAKYSFRNQYITLEELGRKIGWRHGIDSNY